MTRAWIALLAFCALFTVVGVADMVAQDNLTPLETVDAFYTWYLDYAAVDAQGHFNNPMADRAYRDSPYLTAALIADMDALMEGEGLWSDPFLCAQDVPAGFSSRLVAEEGQTAAVLVEERFGLTTHTLTVNLVAGDAGWQIDAVDCGDTVTPAGVVQTFYDAYVAAGQYDPAAQTRRNPLIEGMYRESPWLADALVAAVDAQLASGELQGDPFLCAQDVPQWTYAVTAHEAEDSAEVIVLAHFQGNPAPHTVQVSLSRGEAGWQVAAVNCAVAPEAVIEMVYSHYARQTRLAIDIDMEIDLLENPMRPWNLFLSGEMLDDLRVARAATGVDPLLCAQDVPVGFEVAAQDDGSYLVTGLFPSGPESFSGYPLAVVRGVAKMNAWEITGIRCAR
ncbi:MAG: hypothetical protein Kow0077_26210 [Anaerolineae bacterium]